MVSPCFCKSGSLNIAANPGALSDLIMAFGPSKGLISNARHSKASRRISLHSLSIKVVAVKEETLSQYEFELTLSSVAPSSVLWALEDATPF